MRIFVIGDYRTGSGPANVTKKYIDGLTALGHDVVCLARRSKPMRLLEIAAGIPFCDVVLLSGHSGQNVWALKSAKSASKPAAFLMHGCVEYENQINLAEDERMTECEKQTLEMADEIYTVSHRFKKWLLQKYPQYRAKTETLINGIDNPKKDCFDNMQERDKNLIFSIGGGMPRKKIKVICRAIKRLNEDGYNLRLVVAGAKGADSEEINSYDFVEDIGVVPKKTVDSYFDKAALFIQNSCFETFGLAPMEAIMHGCTVLLTKEIGALDIIGAPEADDIITDYNDPIEIAQKIRYLIDNPNAKRLYDTIDFEECSWEARSRELCSKLTKLVQKQTE